MKTAISIPDPIYRAADRLARHLGLSRSRLYTKAIAAYLERHREEETTATLNQVYGAEESQLPEDLRRLQGASILRDRW
jgi:metal-responsive CopG/Arc/MetJ family transcriptional regulator